MKCSILRGLTLFLLSGTTVLAQFTPGRVVVLQAGSTSSAGNSGWLNEYLPATAAQASPTYQVALPNSGTTDSGTSIVFGNNSAFNHGLSLSSDGAFVVVGGYANNVATVDTASGTLSPRVIATVKYDGAYARPITSSTIFSSATFRCAASDGFGNFWGINAASVSYFGNGTPGAVQSLAGRTLAIANGNLTYTIGASVRAYTGLPTAAGSGSIVIANHAASPSSTGFGIPENPVVGSRAYLADVSTAPGTIQRYDWDGGTWVWQYDITLPGSDKPQYIAVDFSGPSPVIFAASAVTSANNLYAITDVGPAAANATIITLATAPAGNVFRGVVLSPQQPAAPNFTTQPSNVTNNYGSTISFGPVAATGANPAGYTWKKGNTALVNGVTGSGSMISGATTPTLTIANITGADAGTYVAIASNNGGTATSSGAILALAGSSITTQLVSRTNVAGTTATFHVVSGGPVPLSYQWFFNNNLIGDGPTGNGSTISGASTDTLSITTVQDADAGNYTVTVTDNSSAQSSSTASLTVADPPLITLQPTNQNKIAGATASFTSDGSGGALSYQWFHGATALTNGPSVNGSTISGASSSTLTMSNVQDGDAGSYTLTITNIAGTASSDPAILSIGHLPVVNTQPSNATNTPGSTATFTVVASGSPTLTYTWKHNGSVLVNDGVHISGADTSSLTITGVDVSDAHLYSCVISNSYGNVTASALLFVVIGAPEPHVIPGLIVYERFRYPQQAFPAPGVYSWENVISTYNQISGQPAYWYNAGGTLNAAVQANDLFNYNIVTRVPPGLYPWPGIDCDSTNMWYFSSAPNNNHFKFGGVAQTNGAAYFSLLLHVDQGSSLNQGLFDTIGGFINGNSDVNTGTAINTWNYKLCTQADGSGGDGYYLGVFKGNDQTISAASVNGQWAAKHLARGELHFIVGCYKFVSGTNLVNGIVTNDDIVSLWIDPPRDSFGASELNLPTPDAGGMVTNWNNNGLVSEFGLRGSVAPASKRIADLRIGTTWASVTAPYYPHLDFTTTTPNITMAWPAKDSPIGSGYKLRTSPDLLNWTDDPNSPVLDGSGKTNVVTEPPTSPQFWQLVYPPRSGTYGQY